MPKPTPTPSELAALQFLWARGEASVGELHQDICASGKVGYTTVLKRIQRMEEKGLIKRVPSSGRALRYCAITKPDKTQKTLVSRLIETAFQNSPNALIQHAIGEHALSKDEIADIRALLDRVEKA